MSKPVFRIHTLGCGSAKPTLRHQPSSTVVEFNSTLYMIDCGEGAQSAFARKGLKPGRLRHILLTHLHGDHVLGIPGLISSMSLAGLTASLTIHTFPEGERVLRPIIDYFSPDRSFPLEFHLINPEDSIIYEDARLKIRTVALNHRVDDVGYIFEEKPRPRILLPQRCNDYSVPVNLYKSIKEGADYTDPEGNVIPNELLTLPPERPLTYAHISDTSFMPEICPKLGKPDLLFHETTYTEDRIKQAAERGHSTAKDAARIALMSGAKNLLTGHYSSRYTDDNVFLEEARELFPDTILNDEGLTIDLNALREKS